MKSNKIFLVVLFVIAMIIYYATYMNRPDPEVFVMKPTVEVGVRKTVQFVEEFSPEESLIKVKCTCENPLIASIENNRISVTGKFRGTTTITCSFGQKEFGTVEVTVK